MHCKWTFQRQKTQLKKPHFLRLYWKKNFHEKPVMQRSCNGLFKQRKHPWVVFYFQIGGFLTCMFFFLPDSYKHLHLKISGIKKGLLKITKRTVLNKNRKYYNEHKRARWVGYRYFQNVIWFISVITDV